MDRPFQIFAPLTFFEKADAPVGQKRRIAGVVSTELRDKQRELLVQKGLDFEPFLREGWFNDNHSKETGEKGVLGYPTDVRKFQKGDRLPDGDVAKANCTWSEGYLVDTPTAKSIWELGVALKKAGDGRRLGFSIEGNVLQRHPADPTIVTRALVRNVAITSCPVGQDTRLEVLAKSMEEVDKGLSMGAAAPGHNPSEAGPTTGAGAGRILTPQHMEEDGATNLGEAVHEPEESDEDKKKPLEKSTAVALIQNRLQCSRSQAERAFSVLFPKEKVMTTKSKLDQSLDVLEKAAKAQANRTAELFQKSQKGEASPQELQELVKAISGEPSSAVQDAMAPLASNDVLEKGMDASGFLREFGQGMAKSLENLGGLIEKSQGNQKEFMVALAQTMVEQGRFMAGLGQQVSGLQKSLEDWGKKPAAAPRAAGAAGTPHLEKGLAGAPPPAPTNDPNGMAAGLTPAVIMGAIDDMVHKGLDAIGGEPILDVSAKFELEKSISPNALLDVKRHLEVMRKSAA